MEQDNLKDLGTTTGKIDVRISYRIIQLFSEGLYSSPNKAIEELVSNSFDAGAGNVHVILSDDLSESDASIVVIDDGLGMDDKGLQNHWVIGQSQKRTKSPSSKKRKQIGKFGIGKLATFVLANRLTHVTKASGKYFATSMDYQKIPDTTKSSGTLEEKVTLPLRELTEDEAKSLLEPWIDRQGEGYAALDLFGKEKKSWTVAIMSELKPMVREIKLGRLNWVLSTAMPLGDDFNLFLNGVKIKSSKLKGKKIGTWQLGRNLVQLPKQTEDKVTVSKIKSSNKKLRYGLKHVELGRITGQLELFEENLEQGKSQDIGRSWGIFVYVRGRLINADDPYFGISSNKLRHGTLQRFRLEIHIDKLDSELRSSRETVRETSLLTSAQGFMESVFNFARRKHQEHEASEEEGRRATRRVADSPANLTREPLRSLIHGTLEGSTSPILTRCPEGLAPKEIAQFLKKLDELVKSENGLIVEIRQSPLGQNMGIAVYDAATGILEINSLHPFVAYFGDEFSDRETSVPLELFATSEVLLEASMYELGIKQDRVRDVMSQRDQLLRELARSIGKRNAIAISQDLQNAASDQQLLENEVIAALDSLGFRTVPESKKKRIGLAQAFVSGKKAQPFSVAVSVMAVLKPTASATYRSLQTSLIRKCRDDEIPACDHAIVVLTDFPQNVSERKQVLEEEAQSRNLTGKTVTFIRVVDFARIVRLAPAKRLALHQFRELLTECISPEDCKDWVDKLAELQPSVAPYEEILDTIYEEQRQVPGVDVQYSVVEVILRKMKGTVVARDEIISICSALGRMLPEYVHVTSETVALSSTPDRIMSSLRTVTKQSIETSNGNRKKKS